MLLEINDLRTRYRTQDRNASHVDAVADVSFNIEAGEVFGLVGESGCGKSTIAQSIMGTLPRNGSVIGGDINFAGQDLTEMNQSELNGIRWENIAFISQSAMNAFDPVYTVGEQIREAIRVHRDMTRERMDERIRELFDMVGLDPERAEEYPHQFSGGMKQRAMIAMALVLQPELIIADEPTTALDVISQDTILYYLEELQRETDAAVLLITHDMSVVAEICDRIGVMYAGKIAELGPTQDIFEAPFHPYTLGLKNAFPTVRDDRELVNIEGSPPDLAGIEEQCRFAARCPFAKDECWTGDPPIEEQAPGHSAACLRIDELGPETLRERARTPKTWNQVTQDSEMQQRQNRARSTTDE